MRRCFAICMLVGLNLTAFFGTTPLLRGEYWTADTAFNPTMEAVDPGGVIIPVAYPGGKVLINTSWSMINGQIVKNPFLRLNGDGTVDPAFNAPSGSTLFVYPDGRVLYATAQDTTATVLIQRLLSDGSVDPAFTSQLADNDAINPVKAVMLNDGRILLYGGFNTVAGVSRKGLAVLSADGVLDAGFQSPLTVSNPYGVVYNAKPTVDGQHLLVAGAQFRFGTGSDTLARLNLNGTIDVGFNANNAGIPLSAGSFYPDASGRVVLLDGSGNLVRLTSAGGLDATFVPTIAGSQLNPGAQQADGKIYYTADGYFGGSSYSRELGRMNPDGSVDSSFAAIITPYASGNQIGLPALCADNSVFVGPVTADRHQARLELTHVLANGSTDPAFNPRFGRYGAVSAFVQQADGKYIVAGGFDHIDNSPTAQFDNLVRLKTDGTLDSTFNSTVVYSGITSLFQQPSGKIIVNGMFPNGSGGFNSVIRLNTDGSTDLTFTTIQLGLFKLSLDYAGFIYAYTNEATPRLLRYTPDGILDSSFQAVIPRGIGYIAPLADGAVLVSTYDPSSGQSMVRFRHDGTLDPNFQAPYVSSLSAMAALPDGAALICETRTELYWTYYSLSRVRADGSVDYNYVTPGGNQIDGDVRLDMAGAVFDLLRAASPSASATLMVDFLQSPQQMALSCRTDGQLTMQSTLRFDVPLRRYQRTALTSPSMDPSPRIIGFYPSSDTLINLNTPFLGAFVTVSGLGPMNYQWLKDGVPIPGATAYYYSVYPAHVSDSGQYSVQVSNAQGAITSQIVGIAVGTPLAIVAQPMGQAVAAGSPVTLSVTVSGAPSPTYQWQKNGLNIIGATGSTYTIPAAAPSDAGSYTVVATNAFGIATSNPAMLTVNGSIVRDFNGDGKSDIVWTDTATGERSIWLMSGGTLSAGASLGIIPTAWTISGTGDFNGDGNADILLTNTATGDRAMWLMNGTAIATNLYVSNVPVEWIVSAVGDFDGDGKADIFWTNTTTGDRAVWLMNGNVVSSAAYLGNVPVDWKVSGTGDFNGDGKADIVWTNTATGDRSIWLMNGLTLSGGGSLGNIPTAWVISGVGDFDGDGKADILLSNTVTGDRAMWLMNGTAISSNLYVGNIPVAWTVGTIGDFNGDGKADIFWTNTSTGDRAVWLMNSSVLTEGDYMGNVPVEWLPTR